jgi:flagellar basal body-associated protein FliL
MAASERRGIVPLVGILVLIAGVVLIVAGVVTYALVSSKLADQKITVSSDAAHFSGQQVTQPWQAYAEADAIAGHADKIAGGKTYAELRRTIPIDRLS